MLCPFDATTLQVVNRSGVEIDWCPSCKGVWLERGELDKLIDLSAAAAPPPPPAPAPMAAPVQHQPVQHQPMHAPPPQAPPPQYADPRQYERRRDWDDDDDDWDDRQKYGDGYRSKKRKNLLSEIFDF